MTVLDCGHKQIDDYHIEMVNRHSTWVRKYCATCSSPILNNPYRYAHIVKWASFKKGRMIFGPDWVYGPAYQRK